MTGLLLSACAVGPDYVRPETRTADAFGQLDGAAHQGEQPVAEFWGSFEDPLLTRLVEGALTANTDLRAGLARLDTARALAGLSRFDYFPTVTASGEHVRSRASADEAPGIPRDQRDVELYRGGFNAFWELDLFGRVRRGAQASRAEADAAAADLRALQVSVAAETARTYFELRGLQEQLRVARRNAENQEQSLKLTETRLNAGRGTRLDTDRARAQLTFTQSRVPAFEAAVAAAMHRLAVLNGLQPGALRAELNETAALPVLPETVAVGTPADLLRRRPDVRTAERQLAAATARIGVATADLFPRFTFNGTFGSAATELGDLFTRDSESYGFGPGVSWAFLDLGRVRQQIKATDASAQARLALYEGTVLRALEEAETTLIGFARARTERDYLTESAAASSNAARLARLRFEAGAADFLQVLDAERTQLEAEDRLAQSNTRTATSLIAVYKAVAGGWDNRLPNRVAASR
jgi:NodT family efflux transporter outer membrane factor (OMF) lipoprotein